MSRYGHRSLEALGLLRRNRRHQWETSEDTCWVARLPAVAAFDQNRNPCAGSGRPEVEEPKAARQFPPQRQLPRRNRKKHGQCLPTSPRDVRPAGGSPRMTGKVILVCFWSPLQRPLTARATSGWPGFSAVSRQGWMRPRSVCPPPRQSKDSLEEFGITMQSYP